MPLGGARGKAGRSPSLSFWALHEIRFSPIFFLANQIQCPRWQSGESRSSICLSLNILLIGDKLPHPAIKARKSGVLFITHD